MRVVGATGPTRLGSQAAAASGVEQSPGSEAASVSFWQGSGPADVAVSTVPSPEEVGRDWYLKTTTAVSLPSLNLVTKNKKPIPQGQNFEVGGIDACGFTGIAKYYGAI